MARRPRTKRPDQDRPETPPRTTDEAGGGPAPEAPGPASPAAGEAVRAGKAAGKAQRRPRSPTWLRRDGVVGLFSRCQRLGERERGRGRSGEGLNAGAPVK